MPLIIVQHNPYIILQLNNPSPPHKLGLYHVALSRFGAMEFFQEYYKDNRLGQQINWNCACKQGQVSLIATRIVKELGGGSIKKL